MTVLSNHSSPRRRQRLTREQIVDAALVQIEERGAAMLSLRSLARELSCEPMSLYHYVEGIEDVRDSVVDRLVELALLKLSSGGLPLERLEELARSYLSIAEAHPRAFVLVATRLWRTPSAHASLRLVLSLLYETGLGNRDALRQARILGAYLNGTGLALAAWARDDGSRTKSSVENDPQLARISNYVDQASVRADLDSGLCQILNSIRSSSNPALSASPPARLP